MANFVCPHCIRSYNIKKVLYVCPDCGETAVPARGEKEPIKCKKAGCGGLATQRKCPSCGQGIPKTSLETPNLPFSIIGVAKSGKTNYITVMLQELGRSSGLRLALGPQNNETRDHQHDNYQRIYENHTVPEGTVSGESMPQIWYIRNLKRKRGNNVPTYTFTIFDGAGEDHETGLLDRTSAVCRYIETSKAIILTLDPLILPTVRKSIDEKIMSNSLAGDTGVSKNAAEIVHSIASYIKSARGIKSTKLLNIPVAVVLTKFDTVLDHKDFARDALVKERSLGIRDGKVSSGEIEQVSDEIRSWLNDIGENSFVDALDSHFKEFYFFGVSSYGSPPISAVTLNDEINPHRVLDPIYWLFKKSKFID
jgi:hypothetical protein